MIADSVKFRGHRCFKNEWAGFDTIKPINVIIGRNNTGKSHLLDLAEVLTGPEISRQSWQFSCAGTLDQASLQHHFRPGTSGGQLGGEHWNGHGRHFVGVKVTWEIGDRQTISNFTIVDDRLKSDAGFFTLTDTTKQGRLELLSASIAKAKTTLAGHTFRRLWADRDIQPETESKALALESNGKGSTNIIRRYLNSSSSTLPRELIQVELLQALNAVFGKDGQFTEIVVQHHDDQKETLFPEGSWEICLGQDKKGLVALSRSGSGLKTVFLVLLNLLVIPRIQNKSKDQFAYGFEELENNLHPALLRRLFQYLEDYAVRERSTIFLTTHSSVALDLFGLSKNAQIIHVTHDGESAKATTISAHFDHLGVISELGAKPSDLLQANGIIWVEGPSDCIYLNRWIDLFTKSELREGRDYLCAFYGGSLLARTQFASPEAAEAELVNLFRVNPNIIVVCDGDRTSATGTGSRIKDRVSRIKNEVSHIPGAHIWITKAKEIENYVPGTVLAQALGEPQLPDPGQYERFFPTKDETSYISDNLTRQTVEKMDLAVSTSALMTLGQMEQRFDWKDELTSIVERIRSWNG